MNIDYDDRKHTPRFQTNIPAENRKLIRLAAEETGFDIVIGNDTYSNRANHISVWTNESLARDHGPFWREYERLRDSSQ